MMTIQTSLKWHGAEVKAVMHRRFYTKLQQAVIFLQEALKAACSHISSGRGDHSVPGEPPFIQSQNLSNGIKSFIEVNPTVESIEGGVGTDVSYAPTLEFGGALQESPGAKIYATRPILPWGTNHLLTIAPRPFWIPTFNSVKDKLLEIISG